MDMGDDKGYKDTKEFICVGCGKKIVLTKFASQKTCKCDECKQNNVPINPDIVAEALKQNPPKERKKSSGGATKICKCIKCGADVEVSKFMSEQKVLCDNCKGGSSAKKIVNAGRLKVDRSKFGEVQMAPMEEYEMNEGVINNRRLREVPCPSCGHEYMKPLMVIDWSQFGMIINYQCQKCYTTMTISEQTRRPLKVYNPGKRFDYTGTEVRDLGISYRDNSRLANALCVLIKTCEDNNINIDEVFKDFSQTVPPYRFENDKPVPRGFVIPPEDEWIDTVHKAYELLNAKDADSNTISVSRETASMLADKLNKLLKGGNKDV